MTQQSARAYRWHITPTNPYNAEASLRNLRRLYRMMRENGAPAYLARYMTLNLLIIGASVEVKGEVRS
jgi:hypothetical protein